MAMTIMVERARGVTGGVDTHLDVHVAAVLDEIGGLLGTESFAATRAGEDKLAGWLGSFGPLIRVGVEGLVEAERRCVGKVQTTCRWSKTSPTRPVWCKGR
jgi:hypothetical protein